jgi:NAD-dependent SIR2 family protein deacetylase
MPCMPLPILTVAGSHRKGVRLQELYPGNFRPTPTHHFLKLLHDKGLLLRCYTQNIDSLEAEAGLPPDKVVAAHGNFDSARCIACSSAAELSDVKAAASAGEVHVHPAPVCSKRAAAALSPDCPHSSSCIPGKTPCRGAVALTPHTCTLHPMLLPCELHHDVPDVAMSRPDATCPTSFEHAVSRVLACKVKNPKSILVSLH